MAIDTIKIRITIAEYDELISKLRELVTLTQEVVDNLDVIRVRQQLNSGEE